MRWALMMAIMALEAGCGVHIDAHGFQVRFPASREASSHQPTSINAIHLLFHCAHRRVRDERYLQPA